MEHCVRICWGKLCGTTGLFRPSQTEWKSYQAPLVVCPTVQLGVYFFSESLEHLLIGSNHDAKHALCSTCVSICIMGEDKGQGQGTMSYTGQG